jgi:hypothetical protein
LLYSKSFKLTLNLKYIDILTSEAPRLTSLFLPWPLPCYEFTSLVAWSNLKPVFRSVINLHALHLQTQSHLNSTVAGPLKQSFTHLIASATRQASLQTRLAITLRYKQKKGTTSSVQRTTILPGVEPVYANPSNGVVRVA